MSSVLEMAGPYNKLTQLLIFVLQTQIHYISSSPAQTGLIPPPSPRLHPLGTAPRPCTLTDPIIRSAVVWYIPWNQHVWNKAHINSDWKLQILLTFPAWLFSWLLIKSREADVMHRRGRMRQQILSLHMSWNIKYLCEREMDADQLYICDVTWTSEKKPADAAVRKGGDLTSSQRSHGNIVNWQYNIPIILHIQ